MPLRLDLDPSNPLSTSHPEVWLNMTSLMNDTNRLTFRETDEAGYPTATYIYSGDVASSITASKIPAGRVDVIVSGHLLPYCIFLALGV